MSAPTDPARSQASAVTHRLRAAGGPNLAADHTACDIHRAGVGGGSHSPDGQCGVDAHRCGAVGGPNSARSHFTIATHDERAAGGPNAPVDHSVCDVHTTSVDGGLILRAAQVRYDTHNYRGGADQRGDDQRRRDTQPEDVVTRPGEAISVPASIEDAPRRATQTPDPTMGSASPNLRSSGPLAGRPAANPGEIPVVIPPLADPFLSLAADVLDDLERVRIANENRLRQLTRSESDQDGEERGFGLDESHPDVARLAALVEQLAKSEHQAELNLKRQLRAHPLGAWVARTKGVGEKQAARLLAAIGDPFWNDLHNRPRTVSELWAYAGYHVISAGHVAVDVQRGTASGTGDDLGHRASEAHTRDAGVAATPKRGQRANWSATAKMRAYLIAESCVKATSSPYRAVYDAGREKYADAVHQVECKRCGPSGKPAQPGSPVSAGHQHARALRLVAKAVLRDLWREAKAIHEQGEVAA